MHLLTGPSFSAQRRVRFGVSVGSNRHLLQQVRVVCFKDCRSLLQIDI